MGYRLRAAIREALRQGLLKKAEAEKFNKEVGA